MSEMDQDHKDITVALVAIAQMVLPEEKLKSFELNDVVDAVRELVRWRKMVADLMQQAAQTVVAKADELGETHPAVENLRKVAEDDTWGT